MYTVEFRLQFGIMEVRMSKKFVEETTKTTYRRINSRKKVSVDSNESYRKTLWSSLFPTAQPRAR